MVKVHLKIMVIVEAIELIYVSNLTLLLTRLNKVPSPAVLASGFNDVNLFIIVPTAS